MGAGDVGQRPIVCMQLRQGNLRGHLRSRAREVDVPVVLLRLRAWRCPDERDPPEEGPRLHVGPYVAASRRRLFQEATGLGAPSGIENQSSEAPEVSH